VDNELQVLIPTLLRAILSLLWARFDWFFGVNIGIYYNLEKPAIAPNCLLSLGVQEDLSNVNRPNTHSRTVT
jgi:hypothetical protein